MMKTLHAATLLVVLLASSASANLETLLAEYSKLTHDLGAIMAIVGTCEAITLYDSSGFIGFKDLAEHPKAWTEVGLYYQAHVVFKNELSKIATLAKELRDEPTAAGVEHISSTVNNSISAATGTHDSVYFAERRQSEFSAFKIAVEQLRGIRNSLIQRLATKRAEVIRFIEVARVKDEAFFSHEQQREIDRLEREFQALTARIAVLRTEQGAAEAQLSVLRGLISEAQKTLAQCESQVATTRQECKTVQEQITAIKARAETVYQESLEQKMREFQEQIRAAQLQRDEFVFQGLNRLPIEIQETFKNAVQTLIEHTLVETVANKRIAGSFLRVLVGVTSFDKATLVKPATVSISITINTIGMQAPVSRRFVECPIAKSGHIVSKREKDRDLYSLLSAFLNEEIPKVIAIATRYAEGQQQMIGSAERGLYLQKSFLEAAPSPRAPPPPQNPYLEAQPLYYGNYNLLAPPAANLGPAAPLVDAVFSATLGSTFDK